MCFCVRVCVYVCVYVSVCVYVCVCTCATLTTEAEGDRHVVQVGRNRPIRGVDVEPHGRGRDLSCSEAATPPAPQPETL